MALTLQAFWNSPISRSLLMVMYAYQEGKRWRILLFHLGASDLALRCSTKQGLLQLQLPPRVQLHTTLGLQVYVLMKFFILAETPPIHC